MFYKAFTIFLFSVCIFLASDFKIINKLILNIIYKNSLSNKGNVNANAILFSI
jgi:hypothetical protein